MAEISGWPPTLWAGEGITESASCTSVMHQNGIQGVDVQPVSQIVGWLGIR